MAGHTHWRLFIRWSVAGGYVGLNELQLRGVAGGPDLTQTIGGIATASDARVGREASKAFDGDTGTLWDAVDPAHAYGFWLAFEFPTPQDIVEIAIWPNSEVTTRTPSLFDVQYSDDGAAWSLAWTCTPVAQDGLVYVNDYVAGAYNVLTKPAIAGASRYFMLLSSAQQNANALAIAEMRLFEIAGGANVAIGSAGLSDSVFDIAYRPSKAFDNDVNTFYGSNGQSDGTLFLAADFGVGNSYAPTVMQLVARNDGTYGQATTTGLCYKSNDGKNWQLFAAYNGLVFAGPGAMQQVVFDTGLGAIVSQLIVIAVDYEYTLLKSVPSFMVGGVWGFPLFIQW